MKQPLTAIPFHAYLLRALCVAFALCASCSTSSLPALDCECRDGQVCTDEECADPCSPALLAAIDELPEDLTVVQLFCAPPTGGVLGAFSRGDDDLHLTHIQLNEEGGVTRTTFRRFDANVTNGVIDNERRCDDIVHSVGVGAFHTNLTDVAVSPGGSRVAWGVQQIEVLGPDSRQDIADIWYSMDSRCELETHAFFRVSSFAFLDEERVVVSGKPNAFVSGSPFLSGAFLNGQLIIAENSPGSLWRVGSGMLLGGVLGHGVSPARYFSLADADLGRELRLGDGFLEADAGTNRFVATEDYGIIWPVVRWDSETPGPQSGGLQARSFAAEEGTLTFGQARQLAGPGFTSAIPVEGSRRLLLRHDDGLVLVE